MTDKGVHMTRILETWRQARAQCVSIIIVLLVDNYYRPNNPSNNESLQSQLSYPNFSYKPLIVYLRLTVNIPLSPVW